MVVSCGIWACSRRGASAQQCPCPVLCSPVRINGCSQPVVYRLTCPRARAVPRRGRLQVWWPPVLSLERNHNKGTTYHCFLPSSPPPHAGQRLVSPIITPNPSACGWCLCNSPQLTSMTTDHDGQGAASLNSAAFDAATACSLRVEEGINHHAPVPVAGESRSTLADLLRDLHEVQSKPTASLVTHTLAYILPRWQRQLSAITQLPGQHPK